mmetsp:Transcript_48646/g.114871  ORF Transcript_48646/g.114871 Transcript_48646/m.114871 type:complete len:400 (-) Transcript_48646:332-1531(-)
MPFGLEFLTIFDPSALTSAAGKTVSLNGDCSGYCVDNSSDYVGTGNGNLLGDGVIYPAQEQHVGGTPMLSDSTECSYYSCDNSADYIGTGSNGETNLTGDGVIYPKYEAFAAPGKAPMLSDSSECSYFSCDHSQDYIGTTSNGADTNLTNDGVIFPKYTAFSAQGETSQLSGCTGYECDNSADYIGTPNNGLTGDGVIYPKYTPLSGANSAHTTGLVEGADHAGAYYCPDAQETGTGVECPLEVQDPVLIPIKYPVIMANQVSGATQLAPVHAGAYYCSVPEADCGTSVVDPVLKPIQYPVFSELAAPLAAIPEFDQQEEKAADKSKAARASGAHLLLMGHACLFGAAEATSKMASNMMSNKTDWFASWEKDFKDCSAKAANAVSPAGAVVLGKVMEAK